MAGEIRLGDLVAINLRFDAGAEALCTRAMAQLVSKALFKSGKMVSLGRLELRKSVAGSLGIRKVSDNLIEKALEFLAANHIVRQSGKRWSLTERSYESIERDLRRSRERLEGVINRHFPSRIDGAKCREWFGDACVAFYGMYGTQWAATLGRVTARQQISPAATTALLRAVTREKKLDSEVDSLLEGFNSFLNSSHSDDIEHQWSLGQSLLASKLIAANIGPDPITVEDFRDAVLLVDTNALIVAALEAHRLAEPLAQLGQTLSRLGVQLAIIVDTRDEYMRVVQAKREHVLRTVNTYSDSVLRESGDPFIETALDRRCKTPEDYDRFFRELAIYPEALATGVPIDMLDSPEIAVYSEQGRVDEKLKEAIIAVWRAQRSRPKNARATEHDAALTSVAEHLSADGRKCRVLTLDRTMQEHSLQRSGHSSAPIWVSLDALIQVLSVDGAGPEVDPSVFAPLMASIIRHESEPVLNTYTAEDLSLMLDIEERCATLPPEDVKRVAVLVARGRLAGKRREDPELQLQVRRAFQRSKMGLHDTLREQLAISEANLRGRDQQLSEEKIGHSTARSAFIETRSKQLKSHAYLLCAIECLLSLAISAILAFGAFRLATNLAEWARNWETAGRLVSFLGPAGAALSWIWKKAIPRCRTRIGHAAERAETELNMKQ